jgi:hypothetical protein
MFHRLASASFCVLALAGCPKPRTSAMTQPTPAAFDAAASDPKAIELADAIIAKYGGAAAWDAVKELSFTVKYKDGDEVKAHFQHKWDRWNGRAYFATPVPLADPPGEMGIQEVKHDLFDLEAKPWAAVNGQPAGTRDQAVEMAKTARQRLQDDHYFLTLIHKLKDPGVKLTIDNAQITVEGSTMCQPSCTSLKVSFDPAVGKDTWYVNINNDTKEVQVIEKQMGSGRIGYELSGWLEAGGLKFPGRFQNLGLKTEIVEYSEVAVGSPDDSTYMPTVQ